MAGKRPRKLIRRFYAERYLLITIISFALSVAATRFFLELTGYPQIGGNQLHIAHVLWGGILLFAGGLFPLIFANKRALDLSALFSGVGVGLFIDEVGKFITTNNDYFFPAAAPIIYAFFLLTLLVFLLVRRSRPYGLRPTLYHVIEQFEELLEGDLSYIERDQMIARLKNALEDSEDLELIQIADDIVAYLEIQEENLVPHQFDFFDKYRVRWLSFEKRIFTHQRFFNGLRTVWAVLGVLTLLHPIIAMQAAQAKIQLSGLWVSILASEFLSVGDFSTPAVFRLGGEALCGFVLLLAAFLARGEYKRRGIILAMVSLLALLVIVNIFIFYFDQFSSIFYAFIQFSVLMVTIRYNQRY